MDNTSFTIDGEAKDMGNMVRLFNTCNSTIGLDVDWTKSATY